MNGLAEIQILLTRYTDAKHTGGSLAVRLAALERDDIEINARLNQALTNGQDSRPLIAQSCDNLIERADVYKIFAENLQTMETLCRQSAACLKKLIDPTTQL
jgi:hypothetical protein